MSPLLERRLEFGGKPEFIRPQNITAGEALREAKLKLR